MFALRKGISAEDDDATTGAVACEVATGTENGLFVAFKKPLVNPPNEEEAVKVDASVKVEETGFTGIVLPDLVEGVVDVMLSLVPFAIFNTRNWPVISSSGGTPSLG